MTNLRLKRVLQPALFLGMPLCLVLDPASAVAQSNYVFNSAGVSSTATSMSNGAFGTPYNDSETCTGSTCSGAKLSSGGFNDNGSSSKSTLDGNGEVVSLASGTSQNNTTATTNAGTGVSLSISSAASSLAEGNYNPGWAQSPAVYKPPLFHDGTYMFMSWDVNTASTLKVTNLVGASATNIQGGQAFATGYWQITVAQPNGTVISQYTQAANGSSFTARVPANTVVTVEWMAITGAKASAGFFKGASAAGSASVTGTVTIGP